MSKTIHEVFRCTTKSCFFNSFLNKENTQTLCVKLSLLNKLFCSFWWSTCEVDVVFLYLEKVSFTEPHVFCRNEESLQTVQLSRATLQCAGFHVEVLISKTCKYLLVYVEANMMYSYISKNTCGTLWSRSTFN